MAIVKTNERELASKICEWFNEHIKRNQFPFNEATNEAGVTIESTTRFGDIIIWKNRRASEAYAYLELKPPFAAKENLETFRQKAVQFNVQFAFTWDFQSLNAFRVKRNTVESLGSEPTPVLTRIEDWLRGDVQATIKAYISRICTEVVNLTEVGTFTRFQPEKVYFVNLLRKYTEQLIPEFEKFFKNESRDKKKKEKISAYVVKQGITYPSESEFFKLIARQRVYGLITKILFYLTVRRYFEDLPELYQSDEKDLNRLLKLAFMRACEKDWQAVFVDGPIEELGIPQYAEPYLRELFSELRVYHFDYLPEDVIGELFEEIIDPEQRHSLGQYFTREDLVDLVIGTVVNKADGFYGDPTCGSGTFLIRLYDRLKYLSQHRATHEQLLNRIWGIDIGKFPAELSTINLFRQDVKNFDNFPRVVHENIFDVRDGRMFAFPPPHAGKHFHEKVDVVLPKFDGLVGNFPYIRQELIEKKSKGYKQDLTKILADEYLLLYPHLFNLKNVDQRKLDHIRSLNAIEQAKIIRQWIDRGNVDLKLSGQADIYAYIFLHTSTLLAKDGSLAIITSNAWLDVSYGSVLKQFFLDHFKVKMIIASWAEPWFADAAVNTIITVLERDDEAKARNDNIIHFVKLKKKLEDLIPFRDLRLESQKRWDRIDGIVNMIESAQHNPKTKKVTDIISSVETDEMRIRMVKQADILMELQDKDDLAKWGKYLRAPDVYFEILDKCGDKLVPLKNIADVRRGYTTGINEFFYLTPLTPSVPTKKVGISPPYQGGDKEGVGKVKCRNDRGWEGEIESCYLHKVIKSPKESESIIIDPSKLKYYIFICDKSKSELKKLGHTGALKYIEWGEKQRTEDDMPWPDVPSVVGRKYWWSLERSKLPEIIIPAGIADVYKVFDNSVGILNDKRLYEVYLHDDDVSVKYLINSSLFGFFIESTARITLGDGLIDLTVYEVEENLLPDPTIIPKSSTGKLEKLYLKMSKRKVKSIVEELKLKDRQVLDVAVLRALGLDPDEYQSRIYEGLCEMVKERLGLPKMRKKQQKEKVKISYDQVKASVIQDCLSDGVKHFPEQFYDDDYDALKFESHTTSGIPLQAEQFMGHYDVKDSNGKSILLTESEPKAEFAILLAKENIVCLKIPKDEKVVETILRNYHRYVKGLRKSLEQDAQQKLHDWSIAERMAKEILAEYGLVTV